MGSLASLPWDVLLGEPGMVGSPVGEDEIGGLFQPPELRRNTGAARTAPSWKPSRVNRPASWPRVWSAWCLLLVRRGLLLGHPFLSLNDEPELSILGSWVTKGSILERALRKIPTAAPRANPLSAFVLENPAKACWCRLTVISGIEDPLGLTYATCLCYLRLLPLFNAFVLLFRLLPTNGFEDGVPTLCSLGFLPELAPLWAGVGEVLEDICLGTLPVRGIGRGEDDGWPLDKFSARNFCAFLLGSQLKGILQMMEMTMGKERAGLYQRWRWGDWECRLRWTNCKGGSLRNV